MVGGRRRSAGGLAVAWELRLAVRPPRPGNAPVHALLDVTPAEQLNSGGFKMGWGTTDPRWRPTARISPPTAAGSCSWAAPVTRQAVRAKTRRRRGPGAAGYGEAAQPGLLAGRPVGGVLGERRRSPRKVPVDGGPTADVCELKTHPQGLTWMGGDTLVLGSYAGGGVREVPAPAARPPRSHSS